MQDSQEALAGRGRQKNATASVTRRKASYLLNALDTHPAYVDIKQKLSFSENRDTAPPALNISGIQGSLSSLLAVQLFQELNVPLLVIGSHTAFDIYDNDLGELLEPDRFHTVSDELSPALGTLSENRSIILLAGFDDVMTPLQDPSGSATKLFSLKTDQDAGYTRLTDFLLENSYLGKEFVEEEGEFSTRGSIFDIFPFGSSKPVRIEFFGDTITSLRSFDIHSQLSGNLLDAIVLTGNFYADSDGDGSGESWNLLDYLPPDTLIIIDDIASFKAIENRNAVEKKLEKFLCLNINRLEKQALDFHSEAQTKLNANFRLFAKELSREKSGTQHTVFVGRSKKEIEELAEFVSQEIQYINGETLIEVNWVALNLHSGFVFNGFDVYTESDIFGKLRAHKSHKKRAFKGISLKDLQKLNVGDYIVHEDYGIGIFKALETIEVGNSEQEVY